MSQYTSHIGIEENNKVDNLEKEGAEKFDHNTESAIGGHGSGTLVTR